MYRLAEDYAFPGKATKYRLHPQIFRAKSTKDNAWVAPYRDEIWRIYLAVNKAIAMYVCFSRVLKSFFCYFGWNLFAYWFRVLLFIFYIFIKPPSENQTQYPPKTKYSNSTNQPPPPNAHTHTFTYTHPHNTQRQPRHNSPFHSIRIPIPCPKTPQQQPRNHQQTHAGILQTGRHTLQILPVGDASRVDAVEDWEY